ncbi:hypothetical protein EVAR_95856_1 [Eumeta japonica]|uniref:Uncharacterized protein n=1 Tax=Eumeta variegata TaxID=151549 RepID=A0A4C1VND9_EUMVA|nr:hypothetical protein EVAR_95856_1 [Eumeta japonica]
MDDGGREQLLTRPELGGRSDILHLSLARYAFTAQRAQKRNKNIVRADVYHILGTVCLHAHGSDCVASFVPKLFTLVRYQVRFPGEARRRNTNGMLSNSLQASFYLNC